MDLKLLNRTHANMLTQFAMLLFSIVAPLDFCQHKTSGLHINQLLRNIQAVHVTSRCQGLFPPHPKFEGKALGTRLTGRPGIFFHSPEAKYQSPQVTGHCQSTALPVTKSWKEYNLKQQNRPTKHIIFKICLKGNLCVQERIAQTKLTAQLTGFTACCESKMATPPPPPTTPPTANK